MEILFFRIGKCIAGIATQYLVEVLQAPGTFSFLPVTPHVPEMIVHRGSAIGILNIKHLIASNHNREKGEIILLNCDGITFGLKVNKILQVRIVSQSKLVPPQNNTFIPDELLEYACKVKTVFMPILSPIKILRHPEIKPMWCPEAGENHIINGDNVLAK